MDEAVLTLTERLADRLCHDFASSAQAVASGLDLLREAQSPAEREEAESFLAEAVAAQKTKIRFARQAYGPVAGAVDCAELESLIQKLFEDIRPDLDWRVRAPTLGPSAARGLLVLAQLAADILATGGMARLDARTEGEVRVVELDADGPRPVLREEVRSGLTGAPNEATPSGRWAQGAFVWALVKAAGGDVRVEDRPRGVRVWFSLPKDA
ncbi:MAG TPA: histidine phosphotransferase family protein [Caulobacteraceae bacterium]|nr:histidine phosphotransferase family protein [Caulobacteraceae bacterium]